ncbi:dihydrolipoamide acetyltransferase family protein [Alkalihalobacillus sp. TS-13]|uniref:dihydrolipoamide acetyltransferase family protein n=1 Tax=Alkalihalobacillus sp. TS-13 TaxID=2842455 RepID=UPI001C86EF27|nr:dihydrolipoamide acetyltransferase family protein [Alkalihalobacillus sp. TS-13]
MAKEIFMPKLSSTMEEGTLLQWLKEEGDPVDIGEPLFEIMTDKINIEVEAYDEGVLLKKYYKVDDEIPVNQIIGYIGEENEELPAESPGLTSDNSSPTESEKQPEKEGSNKQTNSDTQFDKKVRATPAARRIAREQGVKLSSVDGSGQNERIHQRDVAQYLENEKTEKGITPLAEKIANNENIEIDNITGTGVHGKIVKDDVIAAIEGKDHTPEMEVTKSRKLAGIRKVVAENMQKSVNTAPHVTLTSDIDMTKVKELRSQLLPTIENQTGFRLSYTEVIVKAVGSALSLHPNVNTSLVENEIVFNERVNIGLAVSVDDGLMVPVIKDVNEKSLSILTTEAKEMGQLAREQKLKAEKMKGATFTVSNLGMYAIDAFTPIINLPETAILGIGRIQDKPVAIDGTIEIRPMMVVSLSFDHRTIDGAPAAEFLTELKSILENPFKLLA